MYQQDLIGIRTLEEEGRAVFLEFPGGHMRFNYQQVDTVIIPFLRGTGPVKDLLK
jgi:hypothetical protein